MEIYVCTSKMQRNSEIPVLALVSINIYEQEALVLLKSNALQKTHA